MKMSKFDVVVSRTQSQTLQIEATTQVDAELLAVGSLTTGKVTANIKEKTPVVTSDWEIESITEQEPTIRGGLVPDVQSPTGFRRNTADPSDGPTLGINRHGGDID
jgi:hypothetical protein